MDMSAAKFKLDPRFIAKHVGAQPPWGPLGYISYKRTYARSIDTIQKRHQKLAEQYGIKVSEEYWLTLVRVVEGTYQVQESHCKNLHLPWQPRKAQRSAQEMYTLMWNFKFVPPGRGLWMMGTEYIQDKGGGPLNNCGFISTENLKTSFSDPFCFLMDMSMLGVGVGGDTKGAGTVNIKQPRQNGGVHEVEDSREGWVDLIRRHLDAYVGADTLPQDVDYSKIRLAGTPIRGFGGVSSGPEPLKDLVSSIQNTLDPLVGESITSTAIVDLFNLIGRCVVSGNVRRSAEIIFGSPKDAEFLELKDRSLYPEECDHHRWASNNSLFAEIGMDYSEPGDKTGKNGEPGYLWLENSRKYSRMIDPADNKDYAVMGANPCFSGDTLIAVADGRRAVSIRTLAEQGDDVPVYAVNPDTGMVEIKWARNPRLTRRDATLIQITLDDGSMLRVTPDHKMLLRDGTAIQAKDLRPNDSLPRFNAKLEPVKRGGHDYFRIYCNTRDSNKNKYFEHRLIAQFYQPEKWCKTYKNTKTNGWIEGGLVVHHRDYCPTNNTPDNLEIMTFREHVKLHGSVDNVGRNNPMYGRTHSSAAKKKIGQKTKERCGDPLYLKHLSASHTDKERQALSLRMSQEQHNRLKQYYLEQQAKTDLDTVWIQDHLHAVKTCEACNNQFVVPWRVRGQCYCKRSCMNKAEHHTAARKEGQKQSFEAKQQVTLSRQIDKLLSLKTKLGRNPLLSEWKAVCKQDKVPCRFNPKSANPYVLHSFADLRDRAADYNHRVISVEVLNTKENVYNLSVEDHHTVGIITDTKNLSAGIFTFQCVEQSLESFELCNLVETFPSRHDSYKEYERTLKFAYLYAKSVALIPTHDERTNAVMMRNRRIGTSQSGIVQAFKRHGRREIFNWCDNGYQYISRLDRQYSRWLCVPESIKKTSVKPSGTVSLLPGVTPGIHYPHSEFYFRVIRFASNSPLLPKLRRAGYNCITLDPKKEPNTTAVYFAVQEEFFDRAKSDVSMWEQLENAAQYQAWWADNQVSCTITFNEQEADQIKYALQLYETRLKGISFLPSKNHGYEHAPYQEIEESEYREYTSKLKKLNLSKVENEVIEKFCDSGSCELPVGAGE